MSSSTDMLAKAATQYATAKAGNIVGKIGDRAAGNGKSDSNGDSQKDDDSKGFIGNAAEKLGEGASPVKAALGGAGSAIKDKVKGIFSKGSGGGKPKFSNVIEDSFVGVPVSTAYNQWTQFQEFSKMTKAVTSVDQTDEVESNWKVKSGWFNRSWQAKVVEQVPDERIKWTSEGAKGTTKGVVTFHPIGDNLTAVLLNLEVHHKGLIEQLGRPFKVSSRRAAKDLKLYRRFIVSEGEETGAWRGTIQDGEVTDSGEDENWTSEEEPDASLEEGQDTEDSEDDTEEEPTEGEEQDDDTVDEADDVGEEPDGQGEGEGEPTDEPTDESADESAGVEDPPEGTEDTEEPEPTPARRRTTTHRRRAA